MKKKILIIGAIVIALIAVVAVIVTFSNQSTERKIVEGVDLSSTTGADAFISKIYEPLGESIPNLMNSIIDLTDIDSLTYFTGLTSNEGIEYAIASEPLMSSQAYSLVLVKVTEGTDVEKMKKDIFDSIDTRKWICVEAENKFATDYDNTVIFLMGARDWAVPVYESITNILGKSMGEELKYEAEVSTDIVEDGEAVYQEDLYQQDVYQDGEFQEEYQGEAYQGDSEENVTTLEGEPTLPVNDLVVE